MRQNLLSDSERWTELPRLRRRAMLPGSLVSLGARTVRTVLAASLLMSVGLSVAGGGATSVSAAPLAPTIALNADVPPSEDGLIHLQLIPGASEAKYTMQIALPLQAPKPASCTTRNVTGDIVLTPEGVIVPELSKITVDMRNLNCTAPLSNARAQQLLETNKFPFAEFMIQQAPGLTVPFTEGQTTEGPYLGDQTVHGVTRPVEYASTSTSVGTEVTGRSTTQIKMTDFGMQPPAIPLGQVSDDMAVEMTFRAAVSGPATAFAQAEQSE